MAALGTPNSALTILLLSLWFLTVAGLPLFPYTGNNTAFPEKHNIHTVNLPSDINISFYGEVYNTVYIHKDGMLGFTHEIQYDLVDWSDKTQTTKYGSLPFIAPFFYHALGLNKSGQGYGGHIYYREFNPGSTQTPTIQNLSSYIQATVLGSDHFNAVWGLEVTWANVTSQREFEDGKCVLSGYSSCKKNTFQVLLLVNETDTYAIINYANLDIEIEQYFQAGFNAGNRRGWTPILPSNPPGCQANLSQLPNNQASDVTGRYIFRISGDVILRGGCYLQHCYNQLEIYPSYGGMFGGEMIDVTGPCFHHQAVLLCKFGDLRNGKTSKGVYVSTTKMRCPVPMLTERARIQLSISINGGVSFQYFTHYTVVFPGRLSSSLRVDLQSIGNVTWYDYMADTLQVQWIPSLLSNDTLAKVDITLYGFREHNNESSYLKLERLGSVPVYQGSYQFHTNDHHCSVDACNQYEVGLVEVKLQSNFTPLSHTALYSVAIPLGWYVNTPMSQRYGGNWPAAICDKWYEEDRKDMTWIEELQFCPCSLHQAIADFGRWQPDVSCNLYSKSSSNCYYHKGAVHCFRTVQPSPQGSGNQCCYGPDGVLRFAADTFQGSTPDRSHDWGAAPYVMPGRVPTMSHWIQDVVTFYYCCLWVDYSKCDHYMDQRPTRDCSGYNPPRAATVYGQGHVQTLGGTIKYRISTNGDLVLMKALNTVVQGRFEHNPFLPSDLRDNSSYVLTSVSVKDNMTSDTAEIRLLGPAANRRNRRLEVRINGQFIPFDNEALQWQDFRGLAVVDTDTTNMNSNFTILMTNGVGLQVADTNNLLNLVVMVPDTFKPNDGMENMTDPKTDRQIHEMYQSILSLTLIQPGQYHMFEDNLTGLLGDWWGNLHHKDNTLLTAQSGSTYDLQLVSLYDLQQEWLAMVNESLMYDYKTIVSNRFIILTSKPHSQELCLQSDACNYDFFVTKSWVIAAATLQSERDFQVRTSFLEPVRSCGLLDAPRSIKSNYSYTLGTVTTITGCRTGSLSGHTTYSCESTGNMTQQWMPDVSATCERLPLFPYTGDNTVFPEEHNIHTVNLPSDINISFYGEVYNAVYIHKDGILAFTPDIKYHSVDWSDKTTQTDMNKSLPFIAPFFYNALSLVNGSNGYGGHIYYREFNPGSKKTPTLQNLSSYIQATVLGSDHFNAAWGLEVTWVNVTSQREYEDAKCVLNRYYSCKENTFQILLLVNETDTYAIINYANLDIEIEQYFQAGFNAGNRRGWTPILPSNPPGCQANLSPLPNNQASDVAGRYIFKISGDVILRGGCYLQHCYNQLEIYPSYGGMFGGEMIDVTGPCLDQRAELRCKFGDIRNGKTSKGVFVSTTRMRCPVPMLTERGRIQLSISINGGVSFQYFTFYTVVFPDRLPSSFTVDLQSIGNDTWDDYMADTLQIRWIPGLLTDDTSAKVDITLYGFREHNNESYYLNLETLGSVPNHQGSYQFKTKDHRCSADVCYQTEVGLVEVKLQSSFTPLSHNALYSIAIPLGWYVNTPMSQRYGENWPATMCDKWYDEDRKDMTWIEELLSCPCSLHQAIADFGRWQPDVSCNLYSKSSSNCYYHKGAVHCVRTVQPSPQGSGNQCCYSPDGVLRFAADTFQGSTPDRSHDWGAAPYIVPGRVPSMSHWIQDVVTFYYCCLWVDYRKCDHYMDQRPTRDCSGYNPPRTAIVYGQGHVQTLGGTIKYRISTNGDLVLMKALNTVVQGRFEYNPFHSSDLRNNSSYVLTSVSVRDNMTSDTAEIRLLGPTANRRNRRLEVRINGQFIPFDNETLQWQDFRGMAVVDTDRTNMNSNFTILMTNGVGLQVADTNNQLNLVVMVPDIFKDNLTGLLGDWWGNLHHNDNTLFTAQPGSTYDLRSRSFYDLQQEWLAMVNESLMYDYRMIVPNRFIPLTSMPKDQAFCLQSYACNYDFFVTESRDVAGATLQSESDFQVRAKFLEPVRSCGLLDAPRSIKSNYSYTLGTMTTITGCRTGSLSGHTTYRCESTGNMTQSWMPDVSATCEQIAAQTEETEVGLIAGIVVGAVGGVFLVVVIIVIFIYRRRRMESGLWSEDNELERYPGRKGNKYTL